MSQTQPTGEEEDNVIDQDEVDDVVRDALKDTAKMSADDIERALQEREAAEQQKQEDEPETPKPTE